MRGGFVILIQCLIFQNVFSKEIRNVKDTEIFYSEGYENSIINEYMLAKYKERSITDIWNNIKNTAQKAWDAVKNLANETKEKIKSWVENVKQTSIDIIKSFEERLKEVKSKIDGILQNLIGNENIKKCFQDLNESINGIMMGIVKNVTQCVSDQVNSLRQLEDYKIIDNIVNDDNFMESIDDKLKMCDQEAGQVEECLLKVREDILKETGAAEDEVLKTRIKSSNSASYILDAIIKCSTNGLIEASSLITNETMNVIKCIVAQVKPQE